MGIMKKKFGTMKTGEEIYLYTLKNKNGVEVKIANIGAAVVSLMVPDKNGEFADVVLGFDKGEDYFSNPSFFWCDHRAECEPCRWGGFYIERERVSSVCE